MTRTSDLSAMVDRLATIELEGRALGFAAADELAERIRDRAIALYRFGSAVAARAGILLADTKFEFGLLPDGQLLLIDEVLTPDSSRFWDAAAYAPGRPQASYDKQFVRDWLETRPGRRRPPVRPCRPRCRGHADPLCRGIRTDHREPPSGAISRRTSSPDEQLERIPFAVNVTPKDGILDPQGRAVEGSLPHLGVTGVSAIRVGRRVELTVTAPSNPEARATVERLAGELLSNPLIEAYAIELLGASRPRRQPSRRRVLLPDGPHRRRPVPGLEPRHRRGQRAAGGRCRAGRPVA